jgi:hypothetical protein
MDKRLRLLLPCLFLVGALNAQNTYPAAASQIEFLGKSPSLREIQAASTFERTRSSKSKLRQEVPKEVPNFTGFTRWPNDFADVALPKGQDPLAARPRRSTSLQIEPQLVIEGTDRPLAGGVSPPDPACDVSPEHFIQLTNASGGTYLRVFDLEGNNIFNLSSLNSLWAQFNAGGLGDPIVLYDQAAARWFISEFQDFGGNALLIAISETSDPTGSWFAYRVQTPSFPDYPKYSIWPNAYLVTTNEGGDPNIPIYALERDAMLAGQANPGVQRLGIPKFGNPGIWQTAQPVDWDGSNPPPPGTPGYVVRMYDDAWEGGQDKVEMWEVHIDWDDSGNSFTSGPIEFFTEPFKSSLCAGSFFDCIPQPNGVRVDALQEIILHRVPYLNFGSHEAITLHFAVDVDGNNRAGLRWMELRRPPGQDWNIYQEGTYAPDSLHRFAGAISMDYNGNILMAYSTGGLTKDFSLRFTGRLVNDPLGEMTIEEHEFATGLSSQSGSRWGDYAAMSVNPANGTDFWFVGEYMKANGAWGTKAMMTRIRRDSNDVGPQALLAPRTSGYLTAAEPVRVAMRNFGHLPQADIGISYRMNGGPLVNELITDTIPPDSVYIHTFGTTEDLSVIGPYDFLIYTTLATDTANFNDTLRARVLQLPRNDAALAGFDGLLPTICDSVAMVDIRFRNQGVDTLFSLNILYQLNDEPEDTIFWSGSLPPGAQAFVSIEFEQLEDGPQTLTASVNLPNGVPDENPGNDSRATSFNILLSGREITMRLRTDSWPEETTWELRDEDGNLLFAAGPYSQPNALFIENWCLAEGCYVLTIFDSYGDGLIGPPPGNVQVLNEEGIIIAGVGGINFGSRHDLEFCTDEAVCFLELSADIRSESAEGAADGRIILTLLNGVQPLQYSLDEGETFQASPVFAGLEGGLYAATARDGRNCRVDTTFLLITCALDVAAEVFNAIEGQNNGAVSVAVSGGEGPFTYTLSGLASQDSAVFLNLPPGDYTLTVQDEATGCTRQLNLTVDVIVSTGPPVFFGQEVKLFPNPTEGFVRAEIRGHQQPGIVPVRVYDASGQLVRHSRLVTYGDTAEGVVSFYGLPSGTYYLRFVDEALPGLYPVVKQ